MLCLQMNRLRIDGGDFGEECITRRGVIDDSEIQFGTFRKKDCLLVDLTSTDNEYVLDLLLHRLALCENDGFIDGTAHIHGLWKLQLSILRRRQNEHSLNWGSLEMMIFTRLLNGRKRSGNDWYVFRPMMTAFCFCESYRTKQSSTVHTVVVVVNDLKKRISPLSLHGRPPSFPIPRSVFIAATMLNLIAFILTDAR